MSFINVFEELSKLYESKEEQPEAETVEEEASEVESSEEEQLTEDVEEDVIDEEPVEEEQPEEEQQEEEPKPVILECANCGGLIIKDEADVAVDEESNLANVDEACQYCEETAGYKIIGLVAPYEAAKEEEPEELQATDDKENDAKLDELLDVKLDARGFGGTGNNVSVLSPSLGESALEGLNEDEDLEELLNLKVDARDFGGTGNVVGIG